MSTTNSNYLLARTLSRPGYKGLYEDLKVGNVGQSDINRHPHIRLGTYGSVTRQ